MSKESLNHIFRQTGKTETITKIYEMKYNKYSNMNNKDSERIFGFLAAVFGLVIIFFIIIFGILVYIK